MISRPLRERWQLSILAPAILAALLVISLAVQSVRAVEMHRRAVEVSLRDYSAFAAWQYARRASDYLRLVLTATFPFSAATGGATGGSPDCRSTDPRRAATCAYPLATEGYLSCALHEGRPRFTRNRTGYSDRVLADAIRNATAGREHVPLAVGVTAVPGVASRYLAYWLQPRGCEAMILTGESLRPIFAHVAAFSPLLPPSVTGSLPNDSIVSIRVLSASGTELTRIGPPLAGRAAVDTLGPDLGGIRVEVTLNPLAVDRLTAGSASLGQVRELLAMLALTIVLSAVAVWQLRRSHELIRLRGDFVAGVSHELKTPLTQISLFADTLAAPRERSADERRRYLGIISRESRRLGLLVDSILHFAGMTGTGRGSLAPEAALLGEEIGSAIAAFEPIAAGRGARIEARLTEEIRLSLDRSSFRQVMVNLLDNALKFGPDGQTIVVAMRRSADAARVTVSDEGSGIPAAEQEQIFAPFVRMNRRNGKAGSGIGLAVVRGAVRAHGGRVWVASSSDAGTVIELELPVSPGRRPED